MSDESREKESEDVLPRIDRWIMRGFEQFYLQRFFRKHFHSFAIQDHNLTPAVVDAHDSIVVYANHASWWDPMVAIFLRMRYMPGHEFYAPIDASALAKYRIFGRMGFYGIAMQQRRGAVEFLKKSQYILRHSGTTLWLTPEGRFCDVRDNHDALMPGLAHLAHRIEQTATQSDAQQLSALNAGRQAGRAVWFVPLAMEYSFWEERLPECLGRFGAPVIVRWGEPTRSKAEWDQLLTQNLRDAQKDLAEACIRRDSSEFKVLISGQTGTGGLYDFLRRLASTLRGQTFESNHGQKFQ